VHLSPKSAIAYILQQATLPYKRGQHMKTIWVAIVCLLIMYVSVLVAAPDPAFTIEIQRKHSSADCVSGYLLINGKAVCYVLERPWIGNIPEISAIPILDYLATIRKDGVKGWRLELSDVANRTNVQIHVGNTTADSHGCLLPGKGIDTSLCKVLQSKEAMTLIQQALAYWAQSLQQSVAIRVKISG
jgi:hypothetical protein